MPKPKPHNTLSQSQAAARIGITRGAVNHAIKTGLLNLHVCPCCGQTSILESAVADYAKNRPPSGRKQGQKNKSR